MVGTDGHAPTNGLGNILFRRGLIADRTCPECRRDLSPAGDSSLVCPKGHSFQVGEVP